MEYALHIFLMTKKLYVYDEQIKSRSENYVKYSLFISIHYIEFVAQATSFLYALMSLK